MLGLASEKIPALVVLAADIGDQLTNQPRLLPSTLHDLLGPDDLEHEDPALGPGRGPDHPLADDAKPDVEQTCSEKLGPDVAALAKSDQPALAKACSASVASGGGGGPLSDGPSLHEATSPPMSRASKARRVCTSSSQKWGVVCVLRLLLKAG